MYFVQHVVFLIEQYTPCVSDDFPLRACTHSPGNVIYHGGKRAACMWELEVGRGEGG